MKIEDTAQLAVLGVIAYLLYRMTHAVSRTTDAVGKVIGNWFYDLTHADFVKATFVDGVRLMNSSGGYLSTINLVKSLVDAQHVFPHQGVLYVLGKDTQGRYIGGRAPPGTRYVQSNGTAVQNVSGQLTFIPK